MPATSLNHVSVSANDLEESAVFYAELFGMERIPTPNFGHPVVWLRVGDLQIHLFKRGVDAPVYHHFALTVDDLDRVYRTARERGILDNEHNEAAIRELPDGSVQMYIRDPAGNLVEVDYPDVSELSPEVRADVGSLADMHPQSEENQRSTLFLARKERTAAG